MRGQTSSLSPPEWVDWGVNEVFKGEIWIYVPPKKRSYQPHLRDLDRAKLPKFAWPTRLDDVAKKQKERNRKKLESLKKSGG